jgi:hypothetical protein
MGTILVGYDVASLGNRIPKFRDYVSKDRNIQDSSKNFYSSREGYKTCKIKYITHQTQLYFKKNVTLLLYKVILFVFNWCVLFLFCMNIRNKGMTQKTSGG